MFRNTMCVSVIITIFVLFGSCNTEKPKVLIIGDSISIGYTPFVEKHFFDNAIINHNHGNAKHTGNGLKNIDEWLEAGTWDIIQFNWGLWDLCYRHPDSKIQGHRDKEKGEITFSIQDYKSNLDSLVTILKTKTDAKLIFVTTSYVPVKEPGRYDQDPIRYNEVAKKVMKKHNVLVNDIYEQSIPIHNKYGKGLDDVHYTEEGYEKLSKLIIDFLEKNK